MSTASLAGSADDGRSVASRTVSFRVGGDGSTRIDAARHVFRSSSQAVVAIIRLGYGSGMKPRQCKQCGDEFTPNRADRVYCTGACKSAAARVRDGAEVVRRPAIAEIAPADDLAILPGLVDAIEFQVLQVSCRVTDLERARPLTTDPVVAHANVGRLDDLEHRHAALRREYDTDMTVFIDMAKRLVALERAVEELRRRR